MLLIYGIISGIIAVIGIGALGYRVEYYNMCGSKVNDEFALVAACTFFWPVIAPIAALWGIGHLVARRHKQLAACARDPNKYGS